MVEDRHRSLQSEEYKCCNLQASTRRIVVSNRETSPNTVHLGVQKPYITDRVFWDRQRWRVFLPACQPAFV